MNKNKKDKKLTKRVNPYTPDMSEIRVKILDRKMQFELENFLTHGKYEYEYDLPEVEL